MSSLHEENWEKHFKKLKKYRMTHEYEPSLRDNPKLYLWLVAQKCKIKEGICLEDRKEKILSLAFRGSYQDMIWEQNLEKLMNYHKKHNKYPNQRNKEPSAHQLGVWILKLRSDYRKGDLSDYRLKRLEEVNFVFEPTEYRWLRFYNEVKKWIQINKEFPTVMSNVRLYSWLRNQVENYSNEKLEKPKIDMLNAINFSEFINLENQKKSREENWNEKFTEIKTFIKTNKRFPLINKTERKLGLWIHNQIIKYNKGKLSDEQLSKLNQIKFDQMILHYDKYNKKLKRSSISKY